VSKYLALLEKNVKDCEYKLQHYCDCETLVYVSACQCLQTSHNISSCSFSWFWPHANSIWQW